MTKEEMIAQGIDPVKVAQAEKAEAQAERDRQSAEVIIKALEDEPDYVIAYREKLRQEAIADITEAITQGTEKALTTNPHNPRYKKVYNYERKRWEWKEMMSMR